MSTEEGVRSGISRRDVLKRGAIAGGVVAWTAPTIQVLGSGTAFAAGVGSGPEPCVDQGSKIATLTLKWVGGSCATYSTTASNPTNNAPTDDCFNSSGTIPCPPCSNCECPEDPNSGTDCPTDGIVYITMANGATVTSSADVFGGGTFISTTKVSGPLGFSFTFQNGDIMPTFSLSKNSDGSNPCQTLLFHTSCSKSPPVNGPVRPDYQLGGLLVTDWTGTSGDDKKDMMP